VGDNAGVSNPYAPPEDRPSGSAAPGSRGDAAPGTPPDAPHGPPHAPGPPGWVVAHPPRAPHPDQHGTPGHDRPPRGRSPRDLRPPDPERVALVARHARTFAALLLAAVLTATFPVPWQVASLGFTVLALVVGLRTLVLAFRGRVRGPMTAMLAGGVAVAAFWLVTSLGMTLLWPAYLDRQECLTGALTVTARHDCESRFQDALQDRLKDFQERTRP